MSMQAVSNVLAGAQAAFAKLRQTQGNGNNNAQHFPAFIVNISATQNSAATDAAATDRIFQQREDFRQQRKTEIQQLGQAPQSGDADAAQQAYGVLVALGQNGPLRNGQTFERADRTQDFAAIGRALQSGDLASAKQAFTDLANTFGHRKQQPPGPPTPAPPPTTLPPISNTCTAANNVTPDRHPATAHAAAGTSDTLAAAHHVAATHATAIDIGRRADWRDCQLSTRGEPV
jgi:hypothetical protein